MTAFGGTIGGKALPKESNGAVPVNIQDQHTPFFDFFFSAALAAPTTLSAPTVIGSYDIVLTSAAGFTVGSFVGVFGGGRYFFGTVLSWALNTLTLDTQVDFAFSAGNTVVRLSKDLNVDGSSTPQVFAIQGAQAGDISFDITRFMLMMICDTAVDLNTFGDLAALTRGLVLRKNDGVTRNIWNIKTNAGFALHAYDFHAFSATNPAQGIDGLEVRYTFSGQDKHGVTCRLDPGDTLELVVQDDLTDLVRFEAQAQGHEVTD